MNETAPPQVTAAPAESTALRLPAAPVRCDLAPLTISAAALRCSDRVLRQAHLVKERRRGTIVARRDAACRQARALVTACSTRTGSTGTMAAPPPTVDLQHCVWCRCRLAACMLAYLSVHKLPLHARSASLLSMRTAESSSARLERDGNFRASTPLRLPMLPALAPRPHPLTTPLTVQYTGHLTH